MQRKNKSIKLDKALRMSHLVRMTTVFHGTPSEDHEKYADWVAEEAVEEMLDNVMTAVRLNDQSLRQY